MLSLFLPSFLLALCHVALSWRLERLTDMYAFEGFVYGLNVSIYFYSPVHREKL